MTTTLVELEPGGRQQVHSHEPEQVYFLLEGHGRMTVGSEEAEVETGECVFIPSRTPHGFWNTGSGPLRYFSAAGPSFSGDELEQLWSLGPIARKR